jgi:hypothetical protein
MNNKIYISILLSALILLSGCSTNKPADKVSSIEITNIVTSIGAVGNNINDSDTQSFKFTITLVNNEPTDITIVSVTPILSEIFLERAADKNKIMPVNRIVSPGGSIDVTGEVIFDAKGMTKDQIVNLQPFIKEVKIADERIIQKSF